MSILQCLLYMIKYGHYWLMFLCIIIEYIISGCVSLWLYVIVYIELVDIRSRKAIPFLGVSAKSKCRSREGQKQAKERLFVGEIIG